MRFHVVLPRFPFSQCLEDLAEVVAQALRHAGHDVFRWDSMPAAPGASGDITVVLGAHHPEVELPDYAVVIYQTEVPGSSWFTEKYKARLRDALAVWQASAAFGGNRCITVAPGLMRTPGLGEGELEALQEYHPHPKDIDILFYGSLSPRRLAILTMLQSAGLAPSVHFGVFGEARNALIDRAKLVVDIKQEEGDPDDTTRTFFLDSRGACVLSENDADTTRKLRPWNIVAQCRALLESGGARIAQAASRRAELAPTDVSAAIADLEAKRERPAAE